MPKAWPGHLVAHRGADLWSPANTILGIKALKPWVNGIEIDLNITSDDEVVLMHDGTVNNTTNGTGNISDKTLAQMKALTVDDIGGPTTVPTLTEGLDALQEFQPQIDLILLDVKSGSDQGSIDTIVAVVEAHDLADNCVMMIRSSTEAGYVRNASSTIRLGFFGATEANVDNLIGFAATYDAELILVAPEVYMSNRSCIADIHAANLIAGSSTNNAQTSLFAARSDGCDIILTDTTKHLRYFRGETYS